MDSNKKTKWIPTDKRFVAFLDLLGFKDKVMRSTHEEIYEELHKISLLPVLKISVTELHFLSFKCCSCKRLFVKVNRTGILYP